MNDTLDDTHDNTLDDTHDDTHGTGAHDDPHDPVLRAGDTKTDESDVTGDTGSVPPLPPSSPPPPPPRLRSSWQRTPISRDPDNGRFGGVVAGVARSFGFDRRLTRIAVVVATLVLPVLLAVYGAAWLLLPARPDEAVPLGDVVRDRRRFPLLVAIGLVVLAGGVGSFGSWFLFDGLPWGVGLIAIGILLWAAPSLLDNRDRKQQPPAPPVPGSVAGDPWGAPLAASAPRPSSWHDSPTGSTASARWTSAATDPSTLPPLTPTKPHRRRIPVDGAGFIAALAFALVAAGGDALDWWNLPILDGVVVTLSILWFAHLAHGIVNRRLSVVPGLVFLGVITTGLLVTTPNLDGGVGRERVEPLTVAEASAPQRIGIGELTLDLVTAADSATTATGELTVHAEVGIGRLHILVPSNAVLRLDANIGAGHLVIDGREILDGVHHETHRTNVPTRIAAGGDTDTDTDSASTIVLDIEVGMGEISIDRAPAG